MGEKPNGKRKFGFLTVFLLTIFLARDLAGNASERPFIKRETLFQAGKGGYGAYRIPGIVVTKKGTLLAYAEAREKGGDWDPMDLIMIRSTDGGKTFSRPKILAKGLDRRRTVNNPVMIASNDGMVHLLYCEEYGVEARDGSIYYRKSSDDGKTWSQPVDISAESRKEYRNVIALGPGHGIELKNGTLLVPVWLVPKNAGQSETSHKPGEVSTLYSRDQGATWRMGEIIHADGEFSSPNETTAVELSDGSVMLNMRNTSNKKMRAVSVSPDGLSHWSQPEFDEELPDPGCFGSLARYDKDTLLFVNAESRTIRKKVTIKASKDDGKTWIAKRVIRSGKSAYADLAVDPNGLIHVLVETPPGKSISYYRFPIAWIFQK